MATFSKSEFDLPTITHLSQIDPTKDAELDHLAQVARWKKAHRQGQAGDWQPAPCLFVDGRRSKEGEELREVVRLAQSVLRSILDHGGVTVEDQRRMIERDRLRDAYFRPPPPGAKGDERLPAHVAFDATADTAPSRLLWRQFAEELRAVVLRLQREGDHREHAAPPFKRCAECSGIFPLFSAQSTRVYCSHRCASTVGHRRRYHARKETG